MRIYFALVLLLLAACTRDTKPATACANLAQGCRVQVGRAQLTVQSNKLPVSLQPFVLAIQSASASAVSVTLKMQGMDMGENRYRLQRDAQGVWRASIVLPVCVSGRRDWRMRINVDGVESDLTFQSGAA